MAQNDLTPREQEIVNLLPGGMTNGEIADLLGISEWTVKRHISNAFEKMGVTNRTQAAVQMLRLQNHALLRTLGTRIQVMGDACHRCGGTDFVCYHCLEEAV